MNSSGQSCRTCRYLQGDMRCGAIGNNAEPTSPDRWCTDWIGDTSHAVVVTVMTGRCDTCKWWGARKAIYRPDDGENECALLSYYDEFEEEHRSPSAHVASYEEGVLITRADFGCTAHEPKAVTR